MNSRLPEFYLAKNQLIKKKKKKKTFGKMVQNKDSQWFYLQDMRKSKIAGLFLNIQWRPSMGIQMLLWRQILLLFSCSVVSDSLWPHGLQDTRLPCPLLSPGVCSTSCPLSRWYHPTNWFSVEPFSFSSCPKSCPELESFPVSWLFASGDQSIGASASASVLPMNIQGWFPVGLTGWISLQSKGLSRVFRISLKA